MTIRRAQALPVALAVALVACGLASAAAHAAPVKLVLASHFGREVNLTEAEKHAGPALEDACVVKSTDRCQPGHASTEPGGFAEGTNGVAVQSDPSSAAAGDVYLSDGGDPRVQELSPSGAFVAMFGGEVNKTKAAEIKAKGGTPTSTQIEEEDICTAASGDVCGAGVEGNAAGQLAGPHSLAVDPASGDLYVQQARFRVDKYTAEGSFVWAAGGEVNKTKTEQIKAKGGTPTQAEVEEENLCTAASGDSCQVASPLAEGSSEHDAFGFTANNGLLSVGPGGVLYVGDQGRVQELEPTGAYKGEIPLGTISSAPKAKVTALAVDTVGDVYLAYPLGSDIVRELSPAGLQIAEIPFDPSDPEATVHVEQLALDSSGHLAVEAFETVGAGSTSRFFGTLYELPGDRRITGFTGANVGGMSFGPGGGLWVAAGNDFPHGIGREALFYEPVSVAELLTKAPSCLPGASSETDATDDCTLRGEVNPEGVSETEAGFRWGPTCAFGDETAMQSGFGGTSSVPVGATVKGLRPNEAFCYELVGNDANVPPSSGELLTSPEVASFTTPLVAPVIVGEPSVSFVKPSSAVMSAQLNPENARTEYLVEYGAGQALASCHGSITRESCPGVVATSPEEFSCPTVHATSRCVYDVLGLTLEAAGLQPATTYRYRLFARAESRSGAETLASTGPEGEFTTPSAPAPTAQTGAAAAVAATSATISGTVDSAGQSATYAFELGVDEGANTRFGVVFSGSVSASTAPVSEQLALTGLQPGTTYAYRIALSSGYVTTPSHTVQGAPATFTTGGLPAVLSIPGVLGQLALPPIAFPSPPVVHVTPKAKCKRGYVRDKRGRCVRAKHKSKRHGKGARRKRK